jgi:hypothetical protein
MKSGICFRIVPLTIVVLCLFHVSSLGQSTAFTYQGRLTDNLSAASGTYQMQFALYDAASAGTQIGATIENSAVTVTGGVFTAELDFGLAAFTGSERYIEIRVRRNSVESYVVLTPRQRVASVPYAVRAASADVEPRLKLLGAMRWDQLRAQTFYPMTSISGIAFDGTYLWIAKNPNNTVTKMRPSDLAPLGTFSVGSHPKGMASDGTNIWVANFGSNTVTKLRASDGAVQGTYPTGSGPVAGAFDGTNIWVAYNGGVTRLRASDGFNLGNLSGPATPNSILFDGTYFWVSTSASNTAKFNTNGVYQGGFPAAGGVAFDGSHIWLSPTAGGQSQVDALKYSPMPSNLYVDFVYVYGQGSTMVFDGRNMWMLSTSNSSVVRFDPGLYGAAQRAPSYTLQPSIPVGMAFDGANVWVATSVGLTRFTAFP